MNAVGIDLGGSWIKAGLVDESGAVMSRKTVPTGAAEGADAVTERLEAVCRELLAGDGAAGCAGIGLAAPGRVSEDRKTILSCANLSYRGAPLGEMLSKAFGLPVLCGNDADCAALGEARWGAARGVESVLLLTVGTGLGGSVLKDGKPLLDGFAGELGHMVIALGGERCGCGRRGCCEAYLSVPALLRDCARELEQNRGALWELCGGDPAALDGRMPFEAARRGDPAARAVLERYFMRFAETLVNFTNLFRPELILIGGGLSGAGAAFFAPLEEAFRTVMEGHVYGENPPPVRPAALGNDAGLFGAADLILESGRNQQQ